MNNPTTKRTLLTLGFSPCPNDCFIFDALVHGKIDTEDLEFEVVMADVEELNRRAFACLTDVTKLSYHAFAYLTNEYALLNSGSALGFGVGPLLIAREEHRLLDKEAISRLKIAIPGKYTTANFLLSLAYPAARNRVEMLFSDIEQAVLDGKVDAGLIIHESRFTYAEKGLHKLVDLGEFWENYSGAPIPLGGIVINRQLPEAQRLSVERVVKKSVEYAFAHPEASRNFVIAHAQEMNEEVIQKHISLYVNKYSLDLGEEGRRAVRLLFQKAADLGVVKGMKKELFNTEL